MRIFLIRHGEAIKKDNDSVLTEKGIKQAKNLAKFIENIKFDKIYTSNLTRAKQTFEELKKIKQAYNSEQLEDLNEIYRVLVGGPIKEGTSPEREVKDKARMESFFNSVKNSKNENILIFSHGNVIRYLLAKALNISPVGLWEKMIISPGSISIIEIDKDIIQVKAINLYQHQKEFLEEFISGPIISEKYLS